MAEEKTTETRLGKCHIFSHQILRLLYLQQILENNFQNPQNGTFTTPGNPEPSPPTVHRGFEVSGAHFGLLPSFLLTNSPEPSQQNSGTMKEMMILW